MGKRKSDDGKKVIKKYIDLLFMTPSEVNAKEIAALLQESGLSTQLWEEMNVLEIELPNGNSVDFESIDPNFKDPSDASFIKNRNIKTIFAIIICEEDIKAVTPYFEQLVEKHSGFVCGDSADFQPVLSGSSARP